MVLQAPPPPSGPPDAETDAGVIEDARRRQRRHRRIGAIILAAAAVAALLAGVLIGGGGWGGGGHHRAPSSPAAPGAGGTYAGARSPFPGAPVSQPNEGVVVNACPLAPPNRFLPPRAGCVTVRRLDMNGDGRRDLVLVYSVLSRRHPYWYNGGPPPQIARDFEPLRAYLKVILAGGGSVSTRIGGGSRAALVDAAAHVGEAPGGEIFLETSRSSSGATDLAYGLHDGRLVSAGVYLGYGGDSAAAAGFDCVPGRPPRVIQRVYVLAGALIAGWWKQTNTVYAWHGPRLVRVSSRTFRRRGPIPNHDRAIGSGCIHGVSR